MESREFGGLGQVSALTLGGGGIGQVWGPTSRDESVATLRAAVDAGINLIDLAPSYGDGEAERVFGQAFGGRVPAGVRVTTKCRLGNPPPSQVSSQLEQSLKDSFDRMKMDRVDLFFLHSQIIPDDSGDRYEGTPKGLFVDSVLPAFEHLVSDGRIGAWAITGIGIPSAVLETLQSNPKPAAVQAIANLLDSPGAIKRYEEAAIPRDIIAAAHQRGVGVMGIRAVQAGALTSSLDRDLAEDHPEALDYRRAAPFRDLAAEVGESPASLAHRYSLSMDGVSTVVLGVKNRQELNECVAAEAKGRLAPELMSRIDAAVGRS
ncbi:MAG: hypothetical protein BZY81_08700 [SAR202 cluster bacterium Io17-Chloro-G4]|nr:MAG: hypothetical protein BZY81_08700 [SAR202 cluster bacterium Io17-Chloro-G4]